MRFLIYVSTLRSVAREFSIPTVAKPERKTFVNYNFEHATIKTAGIETGVTRRGGGVLLG